VPASGPIFIVGSTGCGASLLRCLLDRHERIAIPRPTGFMRAATAQAFIPFWPYGERWHRRLGLDDAAFEARLGEFYGGLFREHAERAGKSRWGDATPWHVWHLEALARLFTDASFVGLVRHPGGNVESARLRLARTRRLATQRYARDNRELARQAVALGERCVVLRYEDLVHEPEPVLRELLDWLGEPWSERLLDGAVVVEAERAAAWAAKYDAQARADLRRRVGGLARLFGYRLDDPHARAPLVAGAPERRLLDGAALAARVRDMPGVRLRAPAAPPAERPYDPLRVRLEVIRPTVVTLRGTPTARRRGSAVRPLLGRARRRVLRRLRALR
jgi:Sulfotransferase family